MANKYFIWKDAECKGVKTDFRWHIMVCSKKVCFSLMSDNTNFKTLDT